MNQCLYMFEYSNYFLPNGFKDDKCVDTVFQDKVFLFDKRPSFTLCFLVLLFPFFCNDDVAFTVFLNLDGEDNGEPNNGDVVSFFVLAFGEGVLSIIYYT